MRKQLWILPILFLANYLHGTKAQLPSEGEDDQESDENVIPVLNFIQHLPIISKIPGLKFATDTTGKIIGVVKGSIAKAKGLMKGATGVALGLAKTGFQVFKGIGQNIRSQGRQVFGIGGGGKPPPSTEVAGVEVVDTTGDQPDVDNNIAGRSIVDHPHVPVSDDSDERQVHHHHHHHHHHGSSSKKQRSDIQAAVIQNKQEQERKQLESTAGGFNANINQKNDFSPSFGNIGNIGSLAGRGIDPSDSAFPGIGFSKAQLKAIKKFHRKLFKHIFSHQNRKDLVGYPSRFSNPEYFFDFRQILLPKESRKHLEGYPSRFSNPEYFFDFRHIFLPNESSDSSDESTSS